MNVNLSIGESSEYYNGTLFVNIVNVVDCGSDAFQVGLIDFNHTASGPLLNTMEPIDHWENSVALIFVHPDSVCPIGSLKIKLY